MIGDREIDELVNLGPWTSFVTYEDYLRSLYYLDRRKQSGLTSRVRV